MKNNHIKYQTIEDLLPKADGSVYSLIRMASKRALELSDGKPCLIENPSSEKVTTIALEEIIQGKVMLKAVDGKKKGASK